MEMAAPTNGRMFARAAMIVAIEEEIRDALSNMATSDLEKLHKWFAANGSQDMVLVVAQDVPTTAKLEYKTTVKLEQKE